MGILDRLLKSKPAPAPVAPPRWVLLISDDDETTAHVRQALTTAGFEVCTGTTVNEALRLLDRGPGLTVDMIIGDFTYPELEGKRFLQLARFRLGRTAFPPVVFLMDTASDELVAKQMGVTDVLRKPVNEATLIECVNSRAVARQPAQV